MNYFTSVDFSVCAIELEFGIGDLGARHISYDSFTCYMLIVVILDYVGICLPAAEYGSYGKFYGYKLDASVGIDVAKEGYLLF